MKQEDLKQFKKIVKEEVKGTEGRIKKIVKGEIEGVKGEIEKSEDRIVSAVNESFGKVEGRLGKVEGRLGKVEGRLGKVENRLGNVEKEVTKISATMVTKPYLDDKLADLEGEIIVRQKKQSRKFNLLVEFLQKKKILEQGEVNSLEEIKVFPRPPKIT